MAYSPSLVANAFLYRAQLAGKTFDHMQVQKLVYFTHAWSLTLSGQSVVAEKPEAWQYGPVFSSLYHRLKGYGARAIDKLLPEFQAETGQLVPLIPNFSDQLFWSYVDQIWARYANFSALQLSALTHEPQGPWEKTRSAKQSVMQDAVIQEHFQKQVPNASPA